MLKSLHTCTQGACMEISCLLCATVTFSFLSARIRLKLVCTYTLHLSFPFRGISSYASWSLNIEIRYQYNLSLSTNFVLNGCEKMAWLSKLSPFVKKIKKSESKRWAVERLQGIVLAHMALTLFRIKIQIQDYANWYLFNVLYQR